MHFLCSPFGSSGDVMPMIGLGLELKQQGHGVTFLVNSYFESMVRGVGLEFEQFGTKDEFLQLVDHADLWHPRKALPLLFELGVVPNMRGHYEVCERHFAADPSTVVVSNMLGMGARVAHDKLGVPLVTVHLQPSVLWSDHRPPRMPMVGGPDWLRRIIYRLGMRLVANPAICPALNQFRRELDLEPVTDAVAWWHSPQCVACLFPDWYGPPQPDWPAPLLQTDFPLWDIPDGPSIPNDVQAFLDAGDPPLVFTPGSANIFGDDFFRAAATCCEQLGRRGILLTRFSDQIPTPLPSGVVHFEFAPFSALLPRAACLIHHGGIGSMSQAMAAGIPQVIVALAHDQFDNAERVEQLQVGSQVRQRGLTARKLARDIRQLLQSDDVQTRCRQLAVRVGARDGLKRMAEQIVGHYVDPLLKNTSP